MKGASDAGLLLYGMDSYVGVWRYYVGCWILAVHMYKHGVEWRLNIEGNISIWDLVSGQRIHGIPISSLILKLEARNKTQSGKRASVS